MASEEFDLCGVICGALRDLRNMLDTHGVTSESGAGVWRTATPSRTNKNTKFLVLGATAYSMLPQNSRKQWKKLFFGLFSKVLPFSSEDYQLHTQPDTVLDTADYKLYK